jgi:PAP2 superfamily
MTDAGLTLSDRDDVAPPGRAAGSRWRPTRAQVGWGLWALVTAAIVIHYGVPSSRTMLFLLVALALVASTIGTGSSFASVVLDWLPFFVMLSFYDFLRAKVSNPGQAHFVPQIAFDRWLFGGRVPTVELQHLLYSPGRPHWWDFLAFFVYLSHFFAAFIIAAVLWKVDRSRFRKFALLLVSLSFIAFLTYAAYPAAPPWLASQTHHLLAPTSKIIDEMWSHIGLQHGTSLLSATSRFANPVAAVPSLHEAYTVLIVLFFWSSVSRRWRWLLVLYPLMMALTLVYTAEHFVVDILLGVLYAAVVYFVGTRVFAWNDRRVLQSMQRRDPGDGPPLEKEHEAERAATFSGV